MLFVFILKMNCCIYIYRQNHTSEVDLLRDLAKVIANKTSLFRKKYNVRMQQCEDAAMWSSDSMSGLIMYFPFLIAVYTIRSYLAS